MRFLRVEGEYAEPNSNGDESDHCAVNISQNGGGKPAVDSLSNQRSNARSDNHDRCHEPRYLARGKLAEKSGTGIHHRDKEAAADGDSRGDFEDIDQQWNEDEISRAEKADENPCDKRA